ncbi:MAG: tetratricopeptide repeat protein [Hormoscilla sp.]
MQQGQIIAGHYKIIQPLQAGQLCRTYLAEDTQLKDSRCIIKKLHPDSQETFVIETAQRLFDREVDVLYKLGNHDRIPRLLADIRENPDFYLVQECIDGDSLDKQEIVPGKRYTEPQAIDLLQQVLEILTFVHEEGVIHRDIKPSNLMRRKSDGKLFLIDFGAVKEINKMGGNSSGQNTIVGTPGYAPSEQLEGNPCKASDIYALGMTVIYALTGVPPHQLRSANARKFNWRHLAQVSPDMVKILDKMVSANLKGRYQTVEEVLRDLQPLLASGPTIMSTRKNSLKPILLSVAVLLGLGALFVVPRVWSAFQALQFYNQSKELIDAGSYEEAIATLEQALDIKPDFPEALTDLGYALGKLDRQEEKFSACHRAVDVDPYYAEAWNCRGLARFALREYEDAILDYDRAFAIDRNQLRALYNKGDALLELKRYEQALFVSDKILKLDSDYFMAWYLKCKIFNRQQDFQKALESCDRALEMEPDHQETIKLRKWILQQQSQQQ